MNKKNTKAIKDLTRDEMLEICKNNDGDCLFCPLKLFNCKYCLRDLLNDNSIIYSTLNGVLSQEVEVVKNEE